MPVYPQAWPPRSLRACPLSTTSPRSSPSRSSSSSTPPTSSPCHSSSRATWAPVPSWQPWRRCRVTVRSRPQNDTRVQRVVSSKKRFTHLFLIAVYKSESPQYHSSSLLSQAMVITDSSSLGTLTSLAAVRQVNKV